MTFSLQPTQCFKLPFAWEPVRPDMAADRVGRMRTEEVHSSDLETSREHGVKLQKRQARVTVKYNRKELQRRLDVEKWIDDCLDELYLSKDDDMPDEVNIDNLLDLASNEERVKKLKEILQTCSNNTEHVSSWPSSESCWSSWRAFTSRRSWLPRASNTPPTTTTPSTTISPTTLTDPTGPEPTPTRPPELTKPLTYDL
uniref:Uncharacterized protein n=1 Tax=Oncorhynchus tshawytscha TaxID=74940 RepID=A0AAZ3S2N6_ONCTS